MGKFDFQLQHGDRDDCLDKIETNKETLYEKIQKNVVCLLQA